MVTVTRLGGHTPTPLSEDTSADFVEPTPTPAPARGIPIARPNLDFDPMTVFVSPEVDKMLTLQGKTLAEVILGAGLSLPIVLSELLKPSARGLEFSYPAPSMLQVQAARRAMRQVRILDVDQDILAKHAEKRKRNFDQSVPLIYAGEVFETQSAFAQALCVLPSEVTNALSKAHQGGFMSATLRGVEFSLPARMGKD